MLGLRYYQDIAVDDGTSARPDSASFAFRQACFFVTSSARYHRPKLDGNNKSLYRIVHLPNATRMKRQRAVRLEHLPDSTRFNKRPLQPRLGL